MNNAHPTPRRLDVVTFEMIIVVVLITLHDFLLSDALSLPLAIKHSTLAQLRAFDKIESNLEYFLPILFLWLCYSFGWLGATSGYASPQ